MHRPDRVYTQATTVAAFAGTMAFTITNIYRFTVAGLTPFQLVFVGTAMEATVFVSEVPTGVVADLLSRRWSVIVGHAGMGVAFVVEASFASFTGVLVAQMLWGLSYTFTSGATEAWMAGELAGHSGDPDESVLSAVFFRSSKWSTLATVVALPLSFLLGTANLRLPLFVGAAVQLALVGFLVVAMEEHHFEPAAPDERSTWRRFTTTVRAGGAVIRRSRTLVLLAVVIAVAGGSSEAYDRFAERHLLLGVGVPRIGGHGPILGLALLFTTSALIGVGIAAWLERRSLRGRPSLRRWLAALILVQCGALVGFALAGSFLVAGVMAVIVERSRSVRQKLFASWIVPLTPKAQRATVLSALSQFDAVGQVTVGPGLGAVAGVWGVPASLVTSAVVLAPAVAVVTAARAADVPGTRYEGPSPLGS